MNVHKWAAPLIALAMVAAGALLGTPANAGVAAQTTTIEDTDASHMVFSAGWNNCSGNCANAPDNNFKWTSTVGATATVTFTGTQITLYGMKESFAYIGTAKIDSAAATDVDYYAATNSATTVPVYTSPVLSQGNHTLVLTMTNRHNAASAGGMSITLDRAEVTGTPATTTIEDTDASHMVFSAGWNNCSGNCANAPDNNFKWTSTVGATATVTFTGTQITLYGMKESFAYIGTAKIDSAAATDVDYYAATNSATTVPVYTSPALSQGNHTLVLTMTNRHNAASAGGMSITLDRATVTGSTTAPPVSRYASGLPWSDGGFFMHDAAQATAFAAWRGRPVDNIVAFASRETWPQLLNNWWASTVPSTFDATRDDYILSVPLWTDDKSSGSDTDWTTLAHEIAAVDPNGYVRLGWEMNCCFSLATNATTWRNQFSRAATLIKAAEPKLKIVFNPNEGTSNNGTVADASTLFVEGKVDVVAIDAYDWYPAYNTDANANEHFTKTYGWNYWYDFARSKGLPFALAEFSVYSGSPQSGGDNPAYFTYVYDWLTSKHTAAPGSIAFVSVFNDPQAYCQCNLYPTTPNPNAAARYKSIINSLASFGVDLDDVGPEDGEFEFEVPAEEADFTAMSCPETRNPAKYKITWKSKHIPATDDPVSDWLYPGDSISYKTEKSNTFGFDVTVGAEAEAGIVLAKAKTKIDVSVSKSWTSGVGITRTSKNDTSKGFRAVLGNRGYRVSYTKTKIVAPCNVKTTKGTIIFPKQGDLSFGRYSK